MLVSTKKMLEKAEKEHYAVAQININNLEWTKAVLEVSQELNSPVILGVSEGAGKYMGGYKTVVGTEYHSTGFHSLRPRRLRCLHQMHRSRIPFYHV